MSATSMPETSTDFRNQGYFEFRAELLGASRTRLLTCDEFVTAGRLIYGRPEGFSLYGVPAPQMGERGIRLLGRTVIECSVDDYSIAVAEALAATNFGVSSAVTGFVADLFCGSGNFGHHLGRRLGLPVHASELDPLVYQATRHNLQIMDVDLDLRPIDYRDLLPTLPPQSSRDIYIVEPPWGPAFTERGLDLEATSPPVPEILADISDSRHGQACLIVIKTNDQIVHDSLARSFRGARHQVSVTPTPTLPAGANMDFHIYALTG